MRCVTHISPDPNKFICAFESHPMCVCLLFHFWDIYLCKCRDLPSRTPPYNTKHNCSLAARRVSSRLAFANGLIAFVYP